MTNVTEYMERKGIAFEVLTHERAFTGIAEARAAGALVFEAGTAHRADGTPETRGGRVLTVVGLGPDGVAAAAEAYRAADLVRFRGRQYRTDIGRSQA